MARQAQQPPETPHKTRAPAEATPAGTATKGRSRRDGRRPPALPPRGRRPPVLPLRVQRQRRAQPVGRAMGLPGTQRNLRCPTSRRKMQEGVDDVRPWPTGPPYCRCGRGRTGGVCCLSMVSGLASAILGAIAREEARTKLTLRFHPLARAHSNAVLW